MKKHKRSRFLYLHPETNAGKIEELEKLQLEIGDYVRTCVDLMINNRVYELRLSQKQTFFPAAEKLTSQQEKNARDQAIQIVSGWFSSLYTLKIKKIIGKLFKDKEINEAQKIALYTIGKYRIGRPSNTISQENIDFYHKIIEDEGFNKPQIKPNFPIRLSEMTARLEQPETTSYKNVDYWLRVSCLGFRNSVWFPLVGNPYVKNISDISKGGLFRKTKRGRWRLEVVEKQDWIIPEPKDLPEDAPRIGIDVGLNVLVATSEGDLYGADFKPKFNKAYQKIKEIRTNRKRQGLIFNSKRLECLESKLTGQMATEIGTITNKLVLKYQGYLFVLEDLDLRGCSGQKRFAYTAVHHSFSMKVPTAKYNSAYTSQECPSLCGCIERNNRKGTKFICKKCGRKAHADWVGASGILRRSENKEITCDDEPNQVKKVLQEQSRVLRSVKRLRNKVRSVGSLVSFPKGLGDHELLPLSQKLTVEVFFKKEIRTASNSVTYA